MIVYIASPYTSFKDKDSLMKIISKFSGEYMMKNPGVFAVSGLIHHYAVKECDGLGSDYSFWKDWCDLFMSKCEKVIVLTLPGWETSLGVIGEIECAKKLGIPVEYSNQISF